MEVISSQRLDVHLRPCQHIADRHRLQALGRRVGGRDDFDAFADERQPHVDQHMLRFGGVEAEWRRLAVGKAVAADAHQIAPGFDVGKGRLADGIADCLADIDVTVEAHERHGCRRNAQALNRDGDDHPARPRSGFRLRRTLPSVCRGLERHAKPQAMNGESNHS